MCIYCQPVVAGTNSMPIGTPNLGCSEERNCSVQNISIVIKQDYANSMAERQPQAQVVLGSGLSLARQLCSALLLCGLLCSSPVCSVLCFHQYFSSARKTQT